MGAMDGETLGVIDVGLFDGEIDGETDGEILGVIGEFVGGDILSVVGEFVGESVIQQTPDPSKEYPFIELLPASQFNITLAYKP